MALLKKKIILLNKTKIQQNPQHIELVNLVEQPNNHLEQIIKKCIDKNISLPDIIKEKSPNDEVLQSQIYDIYFRLCFWKRVNITILRWKSIASVV